MTLSESDEVGKLFVGGLSWESTKENLQQYFSQFGEVVDCVVMKNNETGRPRGFGFVTFKDPQCVSMVLSSGTHHLDGRMIDPKACTPRSIQKAKRSGEFPKIFLGGLPPLCTETDIHKFFSEFGRVIDVVIMYDQERKKTRGFGFLSFESEESVDRVCSQRYVTVGNKQVECKRAEPRELSRLRSRHTLPSAHWSSPGMGMPNSGGWESGNSQDISSSPMMPSVPSGYQPGWNAPQQHASYGPLNSYQQATYNWSTPTPYGYNPYGDPSPSYAQQRYIMGYQSPQSGFTYGSYTPVSTVPSAVSYSIAATPSSPSHDNISAQSKTSSSVTVASASHSSAYAISSIPSYSTERDSTGSGSPIRCNMETPGYHPYRRV